MCLLSLSGTPIMWMLVHLMFSQRSLKLSLFLFFLSSLFCSTAVISTTLSFSSLILSFSSLILLLIHSSVFFISVTEFFNSVWLFFIFSSALLKLFVTSHSVHPFFSRVLGSSLRSLFWNLSRVDYQSPLHLVVLLGLYLVPSSGTYSSAISFCLNVYLYFHVCEKLVVFLGLGEVALCRGCPMCPRSTLLSPHPRARDQLVPG